MAWIDEVTDPTTGRTGYDKFGSVSVRTVENQDVPREAGEAMTVGTCTGRGTAAYSAVVPCIPLE